MEETSCLIYASKILFAFPGLHGPDGKSCGSCQKRTTHLRLLPHSFDCLWHHSYPEYWFTKRKVGTKFIRRSTKGVVGQVRSRLSLIQFVTPSPDRTLGTCKRKSRRQVFDVEETRADKAYGRRRRTETTSFGKLVEMHHDFDPLIFSHETQLDAKV